MYGHAEPSSRQVSAATGANTIAPATNATAVALCVSSLPDSSRFHPACTNAAARASSSASVGMRRDPTKDRERTLITTIAVVAALLTFPVVASARFSDVGPVDVHAKAQPAVPAPTVEPAVTDNGAGTSTVLVIAGLTLAESAGFEGSRVMRRKGRAVQA